MNLLQTITSFAPTALPLHCIFIFLFKKWLGPIGTFYASIFTFFFTLLISTNELFYIFTSGSYYYIDFGRWFFCLDLIDSHLVFCADALSYLCASLVLVLTALALLFGVEYMYREAFINRLLYLLNLFATSVIFLFFCYDFFLIMFIWECIGLFSLLLVNFYSVRVYTVKAALKTFVFSRISDMFMFLAFLMAILVFNSTDLSLIFIQTPFLAFHYLFIGSTGLHFLTMFSFLLALSGVIKAAQFFFHVWLPDAMEAPTPASALIHSSTLVVAGVFLIIRFSILFEFSIFTNYFLAVLGAITLSFAAITAIFQSDIKKLVAYSTISQIGYLVCGCGFCCYEEVLIYLVIHALNKAFLFILVGYTVHYFNGNTDMRQMGGVFIYSFDISVMLLGVCINLSGLPYGAGFMGKEFLLFQLLKDDFLSILVRACWFISFFFTPVYMFTLIFIVIYGPKKSTITAYQSFWKGITAGSSFTLINFLNSIKNFNLLNLLKVSAQFTVFTGRSTAYVLFVFWLFFFFWGEYFLLLIYNYSSVVDIIQSTNFLSFKSHLALESSSTSANLSYLVNFFIFFLATAVYFISHARVYRAINSSHHFNSLCYMPWASHWDKKGYSNDIRKIKSSILPQ